MDTSSEMRLETMCLCVPLRLGVLLAASVTFFTSLMFVLDRQYYEVAFRHYTGGYTLASQVVVGVVEYTGVLAGLLGVLGAWYCTKNYIVSYNIWQLVRLVAWIAMYVIDVPLLRTCELWVNDIQRMTKEHGWNPIMYEIALHAQCPSERTSFFASSGFAMLFFMYIAWGTTKYQDYMDRIPKHLLRVPKDLATGAFHSYSTGERSALNGTHGMDPNVNRFGVPFVPRGMMDMMATGGGLMGPPGGYLGPSVGPAVRLGGV